MRGLISRLILITILTMLPGVSYSKTVFVSSSSGDDHNPGTEQKPLRSIEHALSVGDSLRLKAGDVFYGAYRLNKRYLGRYGSGPNPRICGYRRIVNPSWERVENNIWRLSLTQSSFSGFEVKGSSLLNNIGCIHEFDKDLIHGHKVHYYSQLKENWDIWQTESYSAEMDPTLFDYVFLYYEGDPNSLQLEFAVGSHAFQIRYSTIDSINIEGYGFGISIVLGRCTVRNCRIDAIGGMILLTSSRYALQGNGISLYFGDYSVKDCIIEGNYITRCYDCGLCIQGTGNKGSTASNIVLRDNLVTHCCQGIENFSASRTVPFDNCVARDNMFINNGESGFGYPKERFKHCQILENNTRGPKGFQYIGNVFINGNFYCAATYEKENYRSSVFVQNRCFLSPDQFIISDYYGDKDVVRVLNSGLFSRAQNSRQMDIYRSLTGDFSTKFYFVSESRNDKLSRRIIDDFLKTHTY